MIIDDAPVFDLVERPKATDADVVIVQAAISYARRLDGFVDITHFHWARSLRGPKLITLANSNPGDPSQ
jgi:hypothetical protein